MAGGARATSPPCLPCTSCACWRTQRHPRAAPANSCCAVAPQSHTLRVTPCCRSPGLRVDIVEDIKKINDTAMRAAPRKTGMIILGGGGWMVAACRRRRESGCQTRPPSALRMRPAGSAWHAWHSCTGQCPRLPEAGTECTGWARLSPADAAGPPLGWVQACPSTTSTTPTSCATVPTLRSC